MVKRVFDMIAASVTLVALMPLLLAIVALIKVSSRGPVFYRQIRVGRSQKLFRIYKFRTMVDGAEQRGPAITVRYDQRITRVGKFLRRFELDELPTLLNVIKGEMSIVGPRPELPKYLPNYDDAQLRVFSVRPGMTDPATLIFRDEVKRLGLRENAETIYVERILPEKLKLNLEYIECRSFWFDLGLIFKTFALIIPHTKE